MDSCHASCTAPTIDPASQISSALHDPAISRLLTIPVNWDFVDYVIDYIVDVVRNASPNDTRRLKNAFLVNFVKNVIGKSNMDTGRLLVALTYVDRARWALAETRRDWDCEQVFMGALMLADKYTCDSAFTSKHWVPYTNVIFTQKDLNRIEREFLHAIDFDLRVQESSILKHYNAIVERCIHNPGYWSRSLYASFMKPRGERCGVPSAPPPVIPPLPSMILSLPTHPTTRFATARRPHCSFPGCSGVCSPSSSWTESPMAITPTDMSPLATLDPRNRQQGGPSPMHWLYNTAQRVQLYERDLPMLPCLEERCRLPDKSKSRLLPQPTNLFPDYLQYLPLGSRTSP